MQPYSTSIDSLDRRYGKYDLRKYLSPIIDPPEHCCQRLLWMLSKRKTVNEIISSSEVPFLTAPRDLDLYFDYIVFSRIGEDELYIHLFHELASIGKKFDGLLTWNSCLTEQFFSGIAKVSITIKSFFFVSCNLGNSLAPKLSKLDLSRIVKLRIYADPIANKGFKELIKLSLPALTHLDFGQTNLTNDMMNLLTKREHNILNQLCVCQYGFDKNRLLRSLVLASSQRRKNDLFAIFVWFSMNVCPQLGYLAKSKFQDQNEATVWILILVEPQKQNLKIKKKFPRTLKKILQKGMKLSLK